MDRQLLKYYKSLEKDYLSSDEPWKQSGFSGPKARWAACRRPIADFVTKSGTFLDIGCANGYLLECLVKWKQADGIALTPYGLDIGSDLIRLAKERLKPNTENLFIGDAWDWSPPVRFDFVRTELVYVPDNLRKRYIERLLDDILSANGSLLVCEYRSSNSDPGVPWIDDELREYGFAVLDMKSAVYDSKELTRVVLLKNGSSE